ncbi:MAG: sulfur transferase domain-containing protein [Hyphomicrobiaceae bacterium]
MVPVALSDVIAVGEVPTADEITILAKAGFRAILLTQPENEVARLLSKTEVAAKAADAGLAFAYVPIVSRRPPASDVDAFVAALAKLPRPIYACCYSGARTAAAWALAASRDLAPDAVMSACTAAGYDVSFLAPELAARAAVATAIAPPETVAKAIPVAAILPSGVATTTPVTPPATAPDMAPPAIPALQPSALPRAATAGGFAVAG